MRDGERECGSSLESSSWQGLRPERLAWHPAWSCEGDPLEGAREGGREGGREGRGRSEGWREEGEVREGRIRSHSYIYR